MSGISMTGLSGFHHGHRQAAFAAAVANEVERLRQQGGVRPEDLAASHKALQLVWLAALGTPAADAAATAAAALIFLGGRGDGC